MIRLRDGGLAALPALAAAVVGALVWFAATGPASAQQAPPEPMVIEFVPADDVAASVRFVAVLADGERCGGALLQTGHTSSVELRAPAASAACVRPGATITFENFIGQQLAETAVLTPGATVTVVNFGPRLPITTPPSMPSDDPLVTVIEFSTSSGSGFTASELLRGSVTAFADGTLCDSVAVEGDEGAIRLGSPGQPAACRREGAIVNLMSGSGSVLWVSLFLRPGVVERWVNYAPPPPGTLPPAYVCDFAERVGLDPVSCAALRAGVGAPAAGSAGFVPAVEKPRVTRWVVVALALLLMFAARRSTACRPGRRR